MTPEIKLQTLRILLDHRISHIVTEFHARANAHDYSDIGYISGQLKAMNEISAFLEEIENEPS